MFNYTQNRENIPVNPSLQFIRAECSKASNFSDNEIKSLIIQHVEETLFKNDVK